MDRTRELRWPLPFASIVPGRHVRSDTAITGEISLRGSVLPVGGVKEKEVVASAVGSIHFPVSARDKFDLVWLGRVDDGSLNFRHRRAMICASNVRLDD